MITFLDIATFLIIAVLIALVIPYVVITNIFTKMPTKKPTLLGLVFLILFFSTLLLGSEYLASNIPKTDLSQPFNYTGANIGEVGDQATRDANFDQANSLHNKIVSYNFTDPLSFLYEDSPHKGFDTSRTLEIVQTHTVAYSNYYINNTTGLQPTLLKINASLTPLEKSSELKSYATSFLNPEMKNISGILSLDVENRVPALGKTYRELIIRIYDNESTNMMLIDISYDLETGFAEMVNVVYATSAYSFDSPSTVYLETYYSIPGYQDTFQFVVINVVSIAAFIVWIPLLFAKRSTTNKKYPPFTQQYTGDNEFQ